MFFNVSREKSGRPGRSGDVIGRGLGRGSLSSHRWMLSVTWTPYDS